jgi:uncharacterized membrane protein
MIKSELSIVIDAPPEKVFARISDPMNSLEDVPNVVEVKDVTGQGKGMSFRMVYKMAGLRLELESMLAEYIPNEQITYEFKGGSEAKQTWRLTPQNGGCKVDVASEYSIPVPLIGKIAELMLRRQNDREWEAILANIKAQVEAVA